MSNQGTRWRNPTTKDASSSNATRRLTPKQWALRRAANAVCVRNPAGDYYIITLGDNIARGGGATPRMAWADTAKMWGMK